MTTDTLIFVMIGLLFLATVNNTIQTYKNRKDFIKLAKKHNELVRAVNKINIERWEEIVNIEKTLDKILTKEN